MLNHSLSLTLTHVPRTPKIYPCSDPDCTNGKSSQIPVGCSNSKHHHLSTNLSYLIPGMDITGSEIPAYCSQITAQLA